ncbi:MAG: toll/interleukin-1 receptor domain-containing protein [Thiolinea sp.]
MEQTEAVSSDIPVQAWLSYRCKDDLARAKRDELEAVCTEQGIRLVYDESDAPEGTHLIEFMEDLSSARCVFIFLAPDYFESSYTLFELVSIYERSDLDKRFILPLRLTENMVTYAWTTARDFWLSHENKRNELARLLEARNTQAEHEQLWKRINAAWHGLIFPYLDTLSQSLSSEQAEDRLTNRVVALKSTLASEIQHTRKILQQRVVSEIEPLLKAGYLPPLALFQRELRLGRENKEYDIAVRLAGMEAGEAIACLTRLMGHHRKTLLSERRSEWAIAFDDARQLCGWLLIHTIDPVWWFQHELRWKRNTEQGNSLALSLENSEFIEVIISRSIVQPAIYELDTRRQKVKMPYALENDALIFDTVSEGAQEEELFTELYKALFRLDPPVELSNEDVLERIYERSYSHFRRDRNKPVYFLVGLRQFLLLKQLPAFRKAEKKLAGYLQFLCCEQAPKGYQQSPCQENQRLLLDQVALLLSMEAE